MMHWAVILVSLALVSQVASHAEGHHKEHDIKAMYNTRLALACGEGVSEVVHTQWLLPSGAVLDPGEHNNSRLQLEENGTSLIIHSVDKPDFGVYVCLLSRSGGEVDSAVRWAVNVDGPYYGDMWEKYWPRARVGLFAGVSVFLFMSMLCLNLDQFQNHHDKPLQKNTNSYRSPEFSLHPFSNNPARDSSASDVPTLLYTNPAFTDDEHTKGGYTGEVTETKFETFVTRNQASDCGGVVENNTGMGGNHVEEKNVEPKTSF